MRTMNAGAFRSHPNATERRRASGARPKPAHCDDEDDGGDFDASGGSALRINRLAFQEGNGAVIGARRYPKPELGDRSGDLRNRDRYEASRNRK